MKYVTSRVVQPKVVKPFEFTSAMTSFSQSLEEMHAAYDAVVAAEGRVLEMEECLNDCHNALKSIKAYGVNRTNMSVLNSNGKLDAALGLENLQLEALESLSEASKKLLQTKYVAALEGLQDDNQKSLWQKIKDFIAKMWAWIKSWFITDAKSAELVKNCKFEGELDTTATITGLSYGKATNIIKLLADVSKEIIDVKDDGSSSAILERFEVPDGYHSTTMNDYEHDTIGNLGWSDISKATEIKGLVLSQLSTRSRFQQSLAKTLGVKIDEKAKQLAGSQNSINTNVNTIVKACIAPARIQGKLLGLYKREYNKLVMTLVALDKHCKPFA